VYKSSRMAEAATTGKPSNGVTPPTSISRDALLSELSKLADDPKPEPKPEPKPASKPTDTEAPKSDTEASDATPKDAEPETEKTPPSEKEAPPKEDAEPEPDAQTQRALDKIRAREKQSKEALAEERADWKREREREEARLSPRLAELEKFETLKARAKYDPAGVLEALGLSDDDMEAASKAAWSRSKAAKADPKQREAVEKTAKEREAADRLAALEKRIAEREKAETERENQARVQTMLTSYLDSISKAASDSTPLARAHLSKNPEAAAFVAFLSSQAATPGHAGTSGTAS